MPTSLHTNRRGFYYRRESSIKIWPGSLRIYEPGAASCRLLCSLRWEEKCSLDYVRSHCPKYDVKRKLCVSKNIPALLRGHLSWNINCAVHVGGVKVSQLRAEWAPDLDHHFIIVCKVRKHMMTMATRRKTQAIHDTVWMHTSYTSYHTHATL